MNAPWKLYDLLYSYGECAEILEIAEQNISTNISDQGAFFKKLQCYPVESKVMGDLLDLFFETVEHTNEDFYGFDIKRPRGFNLNYYRNNDEYAYHLDKQPPGYKSDIKITAVLNISLEPFQGGEFEFFTGKDERVHNIDLTGSLLIFPSYLYHRVKPVTSGTRISLSTWYTGPNWK